MRDFFERGSKGRIPHLGNDGSRDTNRLNLEKLNGIAPLTRGESQELPGPIFSEHANWTMIREGNFKLVIASDKNVPTELFDLDSDPYEMNNLVNDSGHAGTRDELRAQLIAWRKKVAVPTI